VMISSGDKVLPAASRAEPQYNWPYRQLIMPVTLSTPSPSIRVGGIHPLVAVSRNVLLRVRNIGDDH
jgi:hypothetical protein